MSISFEIKLKLKKTLKNLKVIWNPKKYTKKILIVITKHKF